MGAISSKLRAWVNPENGDEGLTYFCQGCGDSHSIKTKGAGAWSWNGDVEKPVFGPSVSCKSGHFADGYDGKGCWCNFYKENPPEQDEHVFTCKICHTFVGCNGAQPGEVIFLGDCTHALAGTVQPFPDLIPWMQD